jgi:hypothetical protein
MNESCFGGQEQFLSSNQGVLMPRRRKSALSAALDSSTTLMAVGAEAVQAAHMAATLPHVSAQTIHARTGMMQAAAGNPLALADPEFSRMGLEKVEAANESISGMGGAFTQMARVSTGYWMSQMQAGFFTAMRLAGSRTQGAVLSTLAHAQEAAVHDALVAGSQMVKAGQSVVTAGLTPVHRRAAANAKRLTKR